MAKPIITDKPILDQAEFNGVTIWRKEGGSIEVSDTNYPSVKAAVQDIASKAGISLDPSWNTQYAGWYLIQQLKGGKPEENITEKPEKEPQEKKEAPKVEASKVDIAGARVRVYGKAQNRTALGIIHAYMVMYPQAKLEDLKKAFPNTLNPDCGTKEIFKTPAELKQQMADADWKGYFTEDDCPLKLGDGSTAYVVSMWTKPSFEKLVAWAKQYGIVVAEFEAVGKGGQKGGFRLEYLNGYVPPVQKKGVPVWVWIIVAIALLCLLAGIVFGLKKRPAVVEVEKVVVVHDTLYIQQIQAIEDSFNAAEFVVGKAELSDDAKFVLHDLAKIMKQNPEVKLRLEGHTSAEGDAAANQKLSEARAQAAVTFMVEHEGIDASRLEAVGYGSTQLKNAENPTAAENRRTEFVVLN